MGKRTPSRNSRPRTATVAIDLGAASVRVVEMEWKSEGAGSPTPVIVRKGASSLPPEVWNDLTGNRDRFAASIREALTSAGINARKVSACLPRRLVTVRFVRLPHAPPEQMRSMVAYEAQQHVLFALEEVVIDYHVLSSPLEMDDSEEMVTVLLAAAKRTFIAEIASIFDLAGLEIDQLGVSALALSENLRDALEPTALIDLEPGEMDIAIAAEGRLLFTRASALNDGATEPVEAARQLALEVSRSFTSFQNEFRTRSLSHIYLAGAAVRGLESSQVEQILSEVMDIPVTRWQSRLFPPGDNAVFSYTTAAGLALSGDEGSLAPINLVPNERAELKAAAQKRQQQLLAALVAVVAVIAVIFIVQAQVSAQKRQMQEQTRANEQLNEVKGQLTSRQKEYDQVSALDAELRTGLNRSQPTVDVLVALSRCLPHTADIWLTQYGYEKGGQLTLRGETKSALAATDLVIALQSSGNFLDVKLGYLGDSQENTTRRRTNAPTVQDASFTAPASQNPPPPNPGNTAPPPGGMPPPSGSPPGMPSPAPGLPPGLPPMNGVPGPGMAQSGLPPPAGNRRPGNGANAGQNAPVKPNRTEGGLTTFTITCRVNPTSKALVPATLEPAKKTEKNTSTKKAEAKSSTSEEDTTGGEEDESQ